MTVRTAELLMALTMAVFSAYLMWKSTELNIGWVTGEGPGGGFWPFWLSAAMLLSCVGILVNWVRKIGPIATSTEYFWAPGMLREVGAVALLLTVCVGLIEGIGLFGFGGIGFYGMLPVFLFVYLRIFGGHSWWITLAFMILVPVGTFLFFEIALSITLPKGMTEPLFYPIYRLFY
ncbi:MAG: tripartite tricarboxylate transporter TctB family protein [Pseudomonadota bacterium]